MQTFKELTTDWTFIMVREVDENGNVVWGYKVDRVYVSEALQSAWSFFSTIGEALLYADMYNFSKLVKAFDERLLRACEELPQKKKEPLFDNN